MSSKSALTGNSNQTFSFEQMPRMTGNHQKLIELRISNNSDLDPNYLIFFHLIKTYISMVKAYLMFWVFQTICLNV